MYRLGTAGLDAVIEGAGLETAVQQWEARPKALRPIDVEWRTKAVRDSGRKDRTSTEAADLDGDEDKNNGSSSSSSADNEEEDEVAEVTTMEEEKGDAAERVDVTPWDEYKSAEDQNTTERQTEPRCRRSHMSSTGRRREMSGMANDPPDTTGAATDRGGENRLKETTETSRQLKRKNESGSLNQRRTNRRVQSVEHGLSPAQKELHLVLGKDSGVHSQAPGGSQVPWEHRGLLGHTRKQVDGAQPRGR